MEDDWDWESSELGAEASDMTFQSNQIPEAYSENSFGGDLDQNGEMKEIDAVMSFLHSKELDWQEEAKEENSSYLVSENYEEWGFECCMVNDVGKRNEGLTESAESILAKDNKTDNETDNSEYLCDGFGQILCPLSRNESSYVRFLLEPADTPIASEEEEVTEKFGAAASGDGGALEGNCSDEVCNMPDDIINHELNDAFKQQESSTENDLVQALPMSNENTSVSEESSIGQPLYAKNLYVSPILDCNSSEPVDLEGEEDILTAEGSPENSNLNIGITDEKNENEKQCFGYLQSVSETDQDNMEGDDVRSELENKDPKLVDATEDSSVPAEISDSFIFNGQSVESNLRGTQEQEKQQQEENWIDDILQIKDAVRFDVDENGLEASNESPQTDESISSETESSNQPFPEASSKQKERNRYSTMRRRTAEDLEEMKQFNPRPPRFLPIELDPEAEKVDLRHQIMDERKNSEAWMIDYALQQLVTKLTPARKRKVALLVEAFETVMPLPMCDSPLQSPTSAFAIRACS